MKLSKIIILTLVVFFVDTNIQSQCDTTGDLCYINNDGVGEYLVTFCPDNDSQTLELVLESFQLDDGDELYVYEGDDNTGLLLNQYIGVGGLGGSISFLNEINTAGEAGKCITLDFVSNSNISCLDGTNPFGFPLNMQPLIYTINCIEGTGGTGLAELDLKIFLEGAFNISEMEASLGVVLPSVQPYNFAPYNYAGTETLSSTITNVVDWVLVEMRAGVPSLSVQNTSVAATKAAVVLENGQVVEAETGLAIGFENLDANTDYHICIRHRNHLDVLSASSFMTDATGNATTIFDFTNDGAAAFGFGQLKEVVPGVYSLFAGDFNGDGVIQTTDYDLWAATPAILETYSNTDANLDGSVQSTDYDRWFNNKAKVGAPRNTIGLSSLRPLLTIQPRFSTIQPILI